MVSPIPNAVQKIWEKWNIRFVVLFSLSLQTFLILFAPLRKRTHRSVAVWFIWSAYLLADWAANFCVGLISNNQDDTSTSATDPNNYLVAFWTPFLLLHLGGPDTITAFALEDNELWLRHLLGLIFQAVAAAYVFLLTIPGNTLWIPTILMFAAGIIKYSERTRALYLASMNTFRRSIIREPDAGPNYAKLIEENFSRKEAGLPTQIVTMPEPAPKPKIGAQGSKTREELNDIKVVKRAYNFFDKYRGLIVDMIFSFGERNESREFFLDPNRTAEDALRVIEVELNYIYEVFFTKVSVLRHKLGYFFRFVSFSSILAALGLFIYEEKQGFNKFDVKVTYILMYGALALDAVGLLMLFLSDRTAVSLDDGKDVKANVLGHFLNFRRPRWSQCKKEPYTKYTALSTPLIFRRWSGTISGHNLITYCLRQCPTDRSLTVGSQGNIFVEDIKLLCFKVRQILKSYFDKLVNYLGARDLLEIWIYKANNPFLEKLWEFIFDELQRKSAKAEDMETMQRICSARGQYVLLESKLKKKGKEELMQFVETNEFAFDQSLITWHIATQLCYAKDQGGQDGQEDQGSQDDQDDQGGQDNQEDQGSQDDQDDQGGQGNQDDQDAKRQFSKLLADYMLYLLVMQPSLMSAVAGIGQIRFQDTCAEAVKFFGKRDLDPKDKEKDACRKLLEVRTDDKPSEVKGDRSKSLLFDACILAKELQGLKKKKWETISEIWVEMLSYAACNCRPTAFVQQLSKGGELIAIVWLLMVHLGLGKQFQIKDGHARAKLIVHK